MGFTEELPVPYGLPTHEGLTRYLRDHRTCHAKIRRHPYDKASMMTRVLESAGRDLFIDTTSKDLSSLETVSPSVVSGVL